MWKLIFLILFPTIWAHNACLHLIKISSLTDLAQVDLSQAPLLLTHRNLHDKALHVPCVNGTIFEPSPVELNKFLLAFQSLRIASKPRLEVYTDVSEAQISLLTNIHRSFDIVLKGKLYPTLSLKFRTLSVTTFDIWPHHYYTPMGLLGTDVSLFNVLSRKLEFSFNLLPRALSVNGRVLPNGTLVGILPDVQRGVADLAMCQLTLTNDRHQILDYAPVLSEHDIVFVGPKAKPKSPSEALILPFDPWTWVCLCVSLVASFIILTVFKVHWNDGKRTLDKAYEAFCLTITPFIQESISPTTYRVNGFMSMYCFLILWMGMGMLLTLAYKSTLLATMTMINFNGAIDTPQEVLRSHLPVYVLSQSLMETALVTSPLKIYRDIYDQNVTPFGTSFPLSSIPPDLDDDVDNNRAFVVSTRTNTISETKRFAFKDSIYIGATSWLSQKGSRVLVQLSDPIMRLQASGMTNKWFQEELQDALEHQESEKNRPSHNPINMGHMAPPFILLGCSLMICLVVFLVEILVLVPPKKTQ